MKYPRFVYHGSYPQDQNILRRVCQLPMDAVVALYNNCIEDEEKRITAADLTYYENKDYTIVQLYGDKYVAVYKHDFNWWLLAGARKEFNDWYKNYAGGSPFDTFNINNI